MRSAASGQPLLANRSRFTSFLALTPPAMPSRSRRPIGSVDEGIAVRIQERRFFNSLQWVKLEEAPVPVR